MPMYLLCLLFTLFMHELDCLYTHKYMPTFVLVLCSLTDCLRLPMKYLPFHNAGSGYPISHTLFTHLHTLLSIQPHMLIPN